MSTLSYNGVTIGLTKTLGISHQPVWSDDVTYLHTRVTIDVEGLIQGAPSSSQNPATPGPVTNTVGGKGGAPISDVMELIRHRLEQPRGYLVYDVGDRPSEPMIHCPGLDGAGNPYPCDMNNGPIPGPLVITRVDGIKAFHVRYSITCHLLECPGYTGDGPPALIANRYFQSHAIDGSTFLTTITTTGQAVFRTDILEAAQKVADDYRDVLLPPIPRGFKRMGGEFTVTPQRNTLTYRVVDQERVFDLGDTGPGGTNSNITDVTADYSVSSTGIGGAPISLVTAHSVQATVLGSKAASPWTLVKACFLVAGSKLPISDPTKGFLSQVGVSQSLTERKARLQVTMLLNQQPGAALPGINADGLREDNTFAPQGGLNPAFPGRGGAAGTYENELLTSAWRSACQVPTKPTEGNVGSSAGVATYSDNTGPIVTVTVTDDLPEVSQGYSFEQTSFPFTEYKIDSVFQVNTGRVAAPIAGRPASSYQSAGNGSVSTGGGDGPDQEILTLSLPSMRKVVEFTAERVGAPPIIPDLNPSDPNLVLIDEPWVQVAEPNLLVDGSTKVYRASGRYVYALKKRLKGNDPLPFPAPPWQTESYGDVLLTSDFFRQGITDLPESAAPTTGGDA